MMVRTPIPMNARERQDFNRELTPSLRRKRQDCLRNYVRKDHEGLPTKSQQDQTSLREWHSQDRKRDPRSAVRLRQRFHSVDESTENKRPQS
jgi:hypothetical protein